MRLPLVVNETRNPDVAGDVFLFERAEDLSGYLEAWYVLDGECVAYDADGRLLQLKIIPTCVRIFGR